MVDNEEAVQDEAGEHWPSEVELMRLLLKETILNVEGIIESAEHVVARARKRLDEIDERLQEGV